MAERFYKLLENYIDAYGKYSETQLNQFTNEIFGELGVLDEFTIIEILSNLNNRLNSNKNIITTIDRELSSAADLMRPEKMEEICRNRRKNPGELLLEYNNYCIERNNTKTNITKIVDILNSMIYHTTKKLNKKIEILSDEDKEILVSKLNDSIQKKETYIETLELEMASRNLKLHDTEELNRIAESNRISVEDVKAKLNAERRERYYECQKEQSDISFYNEYIEKLSVSKKL